MTLMFDDLNRVCMHLKALSIIVQCVFMSLLEVSLILKGCSMISDDFTGIPIVF